jgi:hypothetical protein
MLLESFDADAQDEIAHLKLGFAKQIVLRLAHQKTGQIGDLLIDSETNLGFEQFRFPFLFFAEAVPDHGVSFRANFCALAKIVRRVQTFYQLFSCTHITSRLGGCCLWDEKVAQRVRSDRNLNGLTPEAIKKLLEVHVTDNPNAVRAKKEFRQWILKGETRYPRDMWFWVILPHPVVELVHGLFVELVLEEKPDPDFPGVVIVNAHEHRP